MSVFGIVVEGTRDTAVYSALIRKIRPEVERVVSRPCGGAAALRRQFLGWLKEFQYPIVKVLVIRDSDLREPADVEAELGQLYEKSRFRPDFPVHFYATRRMVETWLLADAEAIREVARLRHKTGSIKPIHKPLEEIPNPKEELQRMLTQAGLPDDEKVYAEIASHASVGRVEEHCPYFKEFRNHVHAC